ncbi:MAG: Holliday junction DNA helicase RuvA [Desulfobacterales bacterium]|nr:Holliday junction DNA helicase RuvA [Desulfobacterales bacterium]
MIGYLEGKIIKYESDGILLLVNNVGYEVLLSANTLNNIKDKDVKLYIYFHQTEKQPKPVLIGFETQDEKEFFQLFITVDAIGPLKAIKALEIPNSHIARAIEEKDVKFLTSLRGIGKRSAEKIIAALNGKAGKFILLDNENVDSRSDHNTPNLSRVIEDQVANVLKEQLGYSDKDSRILIAEALTKNKEISTAEQLFDDVIKRGIKP